jgi:DNA modification methylase
MNKKPKQPEELESLEVSELIPYARNSRTHSEEQVAQIAGSIREFGFTNPVLVGKDNDIIAGHGRVLAAKKLGIDKVPCIRLGHLTDTQKRAYIIADNKLALNAGWDEELLGIELSDLIDSNFDIGLTGFSGNEIASLISQEYVEGLTDEDECPDTEDNPVTVDGDVWMLGNHRLMCGDSTSVDAVDKLMGGHKADISITSPPYNAGKNIRGNFYDNDNDNKPLDEYVDFLKNTTMNALMHCNFAFVNIGILESNKFALVDFQTQMRDYLKDILVWNKKTAPPHINKGTFSTKWEYVFAFSQNPKSRGFPCMWQGKYTNVIDTENNSKNEFAKKHRAGFPVAFPVWIMETMDFSKSVIDLFCGTGTTMIASEKMNRSFYGMEIDPLYCDLTINRWQDFTGQKAIHEKSGNLYNDMKNAQ